MNTFLKRLLILLTTVALALFLYAVFVEGLFTPRLSPKDTAKLELNDLNLMVAYNRPSKRHREIFGALVPFNKVWRTGANEATTFKTNKDVMIGHKVLKKGKYTLWTIPMKATWKVIFNTKQYKWGVDEKMKPMRNPKYDAIVLDVPAQKLNTTVEKFTIAFNHTTGHLKLTMAWDNTKIEVPIKELNTK